jgi:hypothetical protein
VPEGEIVYSTPEELEGARADERSDVFGLGALAYEAITARPPFVGRAGRKAAAVLSVPSVPITAFIRDAPSAIQKIIEKALASNPTERFATVEEFAGALGEGYSAPRVGRPGRKARQAGKPAPRFTNLRFVSGGRRDLLPREQRLTPGGRYYLRVDIGEFSKESIVEHVARTAFPSEHLPPATDGYWLELIAASRDVTVASRRKAFFLPVTGPSWVCSCPQGTSHRCTAASRKAYLDVPVRVKRSTGTAEMRVSIYYQKNLIQSHRVLVELGEGAGRAGQRAHVDYSLAGPLTDLGAMPRRGLNVLLNRESDDTHRVVINGDREHPLVVYLRDAKLREAIAAVREVLSDVHMERAVVKPGAKLDARNRYDHDNSKNERDFEQDLRALAPLGWHLWSTLTGGDAPARAHARSNLGAPTDIQVSIPTTSPVVFPWALVYQIPIDTTGDKLQPCPILSDQKALASVADGMPACPHEDKHQTKNTLCPYGFWGFRHRIEHPPSLPPSRQLPTRITASHPSVIIGFSSDLDAAISADHFDKIRTQFPYAAEPKDSKEGISRALAPSDFGLVYLYCHGGYEQLGGKVAIPYLGVGKDSSAENHIRPSDITAWSDSDWPDEHWVQNGPLVLINGCHTTALMPDELLNFVEAFMGANASGVVGTEVTLDQSVASEAAFELIRHLAVQTPVAEAIKRMRLHLLGKRNLMGLAYTPFCSGALQFSDPAS